METNIAIVQKVAHNGQYTVEESEETTAPTPQDDTDSIIVDHEYRLTLLELGVTESGVST